MLSDNKKIAKNSLFLYIRMLLIALVSLYTVRVVIKTLGITDYGIYNAVGGIVMVMTFLSQTITSASQRFFSYELGTGNVERLQKIFSSILLIYAFIGVFIVLILETFGLWFFYNKMVIPPERIHAAFWVFQFSLLTFIVTILSAPYNAIIVAHEDMKIFAYVSVVEAICKLLIVYLLLLFSCDRLILYAILVFGVTCLIRVVYGVICTKRYPETKFLLFWNKDLLKSIFSYSSWTMFGTMANAANNQGVSLLLNVFWGPRANAAQSIGFQIGSVLQTFSGNIFTAIRPPLIKSYAEGNYEYMMQLFYRGSKYSFFLLFTIMFPLTLKMDVVLTLWLGEVGEYMIEFARLMMIYVMIVAIGTPITIIVQAANKVKLYHGIVDGFALICIPISYVLYKYFSTSASTVFWVMIFVFIIAHCLRLFIMKCVIPFRIIDYVRRFVIPVFTVAMLSILGIVVYKYFVDGTGSFVGELVDMIVLFTICLVSVWSGGISTYERNKIFAFLLKKV